MTWDFWVLLFNIYVSLTYFLPTWVSVCTLTTKCVSARMWEVVNVCALSPSLSQTSLSFCWDSEQHLALRVKPGVYWSISPNQQKHCWNTSHQTGKCALFKSSLLTLNTGLFGYAFLHWKLHYLVFFFSSVYKWWNSTSNTELQGTKTEKEGWGGGGGV